MAMNPPALDSEDLWRRVGLGELRKAIVQAEAQVRQFEQALRCLPPCDACARGQLLEQLQLTSSRVGREVAGVSMLAGALREAVTAVEQLPETLAAKTPEPCRCRQGQSCTCHE